VRANRALLLAGGAGAFGSLDTALNIAFPDLVDKFEISEASLQWVVVSFVLAYGGLLLAAGHLGDRVGHQRMLAAGAGGSVVAMAACALAPSFSFFVGPALASSAAGPDARGRAVGIFQLSAGLGAAVGPVIGGPLVALGGWPAVFWFRVPVAAALLVLGLGVRGEDPAPHRANDIKGAVLIALGLAGGLMVLNTGRSLGFGSPALWVVMGATVAVAVAYQRHSRRCAEPIIDLALFRIVRFAAANVMNMLANATMFVGWLLGPTLLVEHMGMSVLSGGVVLAASPAVMAAVSPLAGRWSDRWGPDGLVAAGLAIEAVGLFVLSRLDGASSPLTAALAFGAVGLGLGLFNAPNMALVMTALPSDRQGVAGSLALVTRTVGIILGVAGSSALFAARGGEQEFVHAWAGTSTICAAVTGAAAAGAAVLALDRVRQSAPRPA
jgi:MFS family permease